MSAAQMRDYIRCPPNHCFSCMVLERPCRLTLSGGRCLKVPYPIRRHATQPAMPEALPPVNWQRLRTLHTISPRALDLPATLELDMREEHPP